MDPISLLTIVSSAVGFIDFLKREPTEADIELIMAQVVQSSTKTVNVGGVAQQQNALANVAPAEIRAAVASVIKIARTDKKFLNRIKTRCLPPYDKAIEEGDDVDVSEARETARRCVCFSIKTARDDNEGKFPSAEFRELWKQFNCSAL